MHLKNLSRLRADNDLISSAPVHDLVATRIVLPADKEKMAKNTDVKFAWAMRKIVNFVDMSFLSTPLLEEYKILLQERGDNLDLRSGVVRHGCQTPPRYCEAKLRVALFQKPVHMQRRA
jgi:hypothetical protein